MKINDTDDNDRIDRTSDLWAVGHINIRPEGNRIQNLKWDLIFIPILVQLKCS